jgi:hypothetical protein
MEFAMNIIGGATRVVTRTADATTAAAGAVSGAAINGIVGGVQGTATGIRNGLSAGSHSTPAALLTLGAIGATGLVEWPILLAVGGTALLVHQFARRNGEATTAKPSSKSASSTPPAKARRATSRRPAKKSAPRKTAPRKTASRSGRPARAAARRSS